MFNVITALYLIICYLQHFLFHGLLPKLTVIFSNLLAQIKHSYSSRTTVKLFCSLADIQNIPYLL